MLLKAKMSVYPLAALLSEDPPGSRVCAIPPRVASLSHITHLRLSDCVSFLSSGGGMKPKGVSLDNIRNA